jgi:tetratricopeptide (TPR) repeat protein
MRFRLLSSLVLVVAWNAGAGSAPASLELPADAVTGMQHLYSGQFDRSIAFFRRLQIHEPENPLGYLLEVNALWWKTYCETCEFQWGTVDAWQRSPQPEDKIYFALADRAIELTEMQLRKSQTAELHLYAGMGWALRARMLGLHGERLATARAGVRAREHFLRALALDPQLADALTGLGLYNYFVDTLSPIVKALRFFLGIPGGNKQEGIHQLETAAASGKLTAVEARFYLAKNLRNYDQQYPRAIEVMEPLVQMYPQNVLFRLFLGDLYAHAGHNHEAREQLQRAQQLASQRKDSHPACAQRIASLAEILLAHLPRE